MPKPLDEEIKCRVPADVRQRLLALAEAREVKLAVVLRDALREYLASEPPPPATARHEVAA